MIRAPPLFRPKIPREHTTKTTVVIRPPHRFRRVPMEQEQEDPTMGLIPFHFLSFSFCFLLFPLIFFSCSFLLISFSFHFLLFLFIFYHFPSISFRFLSFVITVVNAFDLILKQVSRQFSKTCTDKGPPLFWPLELQIKGALTPP